MTLLRCENKLVYFAHIPKTGGSSVEFAMREAGAKRALHFHKKLDYVKCNLQHMHAELFDTFVPPSFYDFGFCVVRHPFARLTSEYRWRSEIGKVNRSFSDWVVHHINAYSKNPYLLDNHFRPQNEFVGKKILTFKFEDGIPNVLNKLSGMTGLPIKPDTHKRKSTEKEQLQWSETAKAMAVDFYQTDFEMFGYDQSEEIEKLELKL